MILLPSKMLRFIIFLLIRFLLAKLARKWAEAVGQALHYGYMTKLKPGIILIKKRSDDKYIKRVKTLIDHYQLPIDITVIEVK